MTFFRNLNLLALGLCLTCLFVYSNISQETVASLDKTLEDAKKASSDARKRLAVRRAIRNAEELINANQNKPERFLVLAFLFRAQQTLITLDDDYKHRVALLETCRTLMKAPKDFAHLAFEADLLLSQAELAKKGAGNEERAAALRPFVARYLETSESAKVLRLAMVMALEYGDVKLIADLREMIATYHAADHEMIAFQRDKLGGQVFGAPFSGTFKRSDGQILRFPMDGFGRSILMLFWSKEGEEGIAAVKGLAETTQRLKDELAGRMEVISFNLDELPDAGESVIRKYGADWQCLHLPDGKNSSIYKTYVRRNPLALRVSSTGQSAIIMAGVGRVRLKEDGTTDWDRTFGSAFARPWTRYNYCSQLSSISAGDFLVFDPLDFDPTCPPELKALQVGDSNKLKREGNFVPDEVLIAIQQSIVAPPTRYLLSYDETLATYSKTVELCRKAISDHADASNLWIVRNRLMISLMGLWKVGGDLKYLEMAFEEAEEFMDKSYPVGGDVVARLCLARQLLRDPNVDTREVIDNFVGPTGPSKATGVVLAAASVLAMDVCDRIRFEQFREIITMRHTENPMMWTKVAFLLNRQHEYWMFQVPFTAGWSYGRREGRFLSRGDPEEANRKLKGILLDAEGNPFRIPEDLEKEYTIMSFSSPGPWSTQRDDGLPPSPIGNIRNYSDFAAARPNSDVEACFVLFSEQPHSGVIRDRKGVESPLGGTMLSLPNGISNPLVHQIGMLSTDRGLNTVVIDQQGRLIAVISGLGRFGGNAVMNVIARQDELRVLGMIEKGEASKAKDFIYTIAPRYDPDAVDERGRKLRKPNYNISHLRARARASFAVGELDKALVDAEQVYFKQLSQDGAMSMKSDQLAVDEAFRDEIKRRIN